MTRRDGSSQSPAEAAECGGLENILTLISVYYCYILKSLKDSRYYYGFTSDLDERLKKHNAGGVTSTRYRTPLVLHYFEKFGSKSEALAREKFLKSFQGRQWLHANNII